MQLQWQYRIYGRGIAGHYVEAEGDGNPPAQWIEWTEQQNEESNGHAYSKKYIFELGNIKFNEFN